MEHKAIEVNIIYIYRAAKLRHIKRNSNSTNFQLFQGHRIIMITN